MRLLQLRRALQHVRRLQAGSAGLKDAVAAAASFKDARGEHSGSSSDCYDVEAAGTQEAKRAAAAAAAQQAAASSHATHATEPQAAPATTLPTSVSFALAVPSPVTTPTATAAAAKHPRTAKQAPVAPRTAAAGHAPKAANGAGRGAPSGIPSPPPAALSAQAHEAAHTSDRAPRDASKPRSRLSHTGSSQVREWGVCGRPRAGPGACARACASTHGPHAPMHGAHALAAGPSPARRQRCAGSVR